MYNTKINSPTFIRGSIKHQQVYLINLHFGDTIFS